MKRIIKLLIPILIIAIKSYSQTPFPVVQPSGNSQSLSSINGGVISGKGFINKVYADTTAANLDSNHISYYPGAQIMANNTMWVRSTNAKFWFPLGVQSGTGILSINGLTAANQALETGTAGTDFNISPAGITNTFNLPQADSTHTGKLSNTDWIRFNNGGDKTMQQTFDKSITEGSSPIIAIGSNIFDISQANGSNPIFYIDPANQAILQSPDESMGVILSWTPGVATFYAGSAGVQLNRGSGVTTLNGSSVSMFGLYRMPGADGTANQIIQTNGSGTLSFVDPSTLTGFWKLTGNAGITPVTNFLGTTDSKSIWIKTNNTSVGIIDSTGKWGIGNTAPVSLLQVGTGTNGLYVDVTGTVQVGTGTVRQSTMSIDRILNANYNGGYHGYEDKTSLDNTGSTNAYASYDAQPIITGSQSYDHFVGFQSRPEIQGSATITSRFEAFNAGLVNNSSGAIATASGVRVLDVGGTGVGVIDNDYGLRIENILKGTVNWAIKTGNGVVSLGDSLRVAGTSVFFKNMMVGTTALPTLPNAVTIKAATLASGITAGLRIWNSGGSAGVGAGIDLGYGDDSIRTGRFAVMSDALAGRSFVWLTAAGTSTQAEVMRLKYNGNLGIGVTSPTAYVNLKAGTTAVGSNPLKFTAGSPSTTPEVGSVSFNTGLLMLDSSNSVRDTLATRSWDRNNIAAGYLPIAGYAYPTTTGNGLALTTSTLTTGNLVSLVSTSTVGNGFSLSSISSTGINGTASKTVTGETISVTNTGTTNTNVGLNVTASGATNNFPAIFMGGNVGIGTTTPTTANLNIVETAGAGLIITGSSSVNNADFAIKTFSGNGFWDFAAQQTGAGGAPVNGSFLIFDALNTKYPFVIEPATPNGTLYLKSTGNVGIGTTNPTAYVTLKAGTTAASTNPLKFTSGPPSTTPEIGSMSFSNGLYIIDSSNSVRDTIETRSYSRNSYVSSTGTTGDINSYSATNTPSRIAAVAAGQLFASAGTGTLPVWSASPTLSTSLTTPLLIGGTGTTSTLTYKTTTGTGATGADHIFLVGTNGGTEAMRILNNGNVGIGTNNPAVLLQVSKNQNAATTVTIGNSTSGGAQQVQLNLDITGISEVDLKNFGNSYSTSGSFMANRGVLYGNGANGVAVTAGNAAGYFTVYTGGNTAERLRVSAAGNVSIGTASNGTALLTIAAGTATAGTAPFKLTGGTNLSVTEAGAMEFDGTHLYFTIANAGTRYQLDQQSGGITIGTSTITGGSTGNVLYNNAGVVGEMTTTGSGTVLALATSPILVTPNIGVATATSLQFNATTTNGNLLVAGLGTGLSGSLSTGQYITGGNNIQFRVGYRGSTSTVATAGADVFAVAIGDNTYTEAVSGVSALAGGLYVKTQTVTNGTGTTTDFQNVYIGDAPASVATNNWALNTGSTKIRGKLSITTGSNASAGSVALVGGTATVSTTSVTASSLIFLTDATTGALTNIGNPTVGTIVAGTSFVINSTNVLDTSTVNWWIIN